jgi:hypothetical protein
MSILLSGFYIKLKVSWCLISVCQMQGVDQGSDFELSDFTDLFV